MREYLETDIGTSRERDLIFSDEEDISEQRIVAFKMSVDVKKIDSVATQGVDFLMDIRKLEAEYGPEGIYSYATAYLDFEQYVVFTNETFLSCGLSIVAVILVILFITASFQITIMVTIAVLLVDLFIVALVHFWSLTFNNIVVVQVVIAIGLAVDYSAHIAHTYLIVEPPKTLRSLKAKRMYKASRSLS